MTFSSKTLSLLVLISLALNVIVMLVLIATAGRKTRLTGASSQIDDLLQGVLDGHARSLARLESAIRKLASADRRQNYVIQGAVQHIGMVRYDAFEDVGGRLSFSCALLDDRGDGVVITSINGRQDTRVYAKPIGGGKSSHNLSQEEFSAIQQALSRPREAVSAG
ncbi:MAG: DUF4446 family protein [Actinomycetota bacterium]